LVLAHLSVWALLSEQQPGWEQALMWQLVQPARRTQPEQFLQAAENLENVTVS